MDRNISFLLAGIAGYVDAYGYITIKTYLSFMSGNTTQLGFSIVQGSLTATLATFTSIISFFTGIFLGNILIQINSEKLKWISLAPTVFLLTIYLFLANFLKPSTELSIVLLSLSMGFMNTAVSKVGSQSVNPDFVTGTLNSMAQHLAFAVKKKYPEDSLGDWDTHLTRFTMLLKIWFCFLSGSAISTLISPELNSFTIVIPSMVLLTIGIYRYR
ncbi:YoaK family protein [Pedobacter duraquae]|uniref:YoaK family protein n=1 Tax=Pedobacter duraquae TaxID=425511 RepID=UPI001414E99B|nr:YoaK family protein [Pedobacter duraquae]